MENDRFTFFRSYYEAIDGLPNKVQLEVLKAIIEYALDGREPEGLSRMAAAIFTMAKPVISARPRGGQPGNHNGPNGRRGNGGRKPNEAGPEAEPETESEPNRTEYGTENGTEDFSVETEKTELKEHGTWNMDLEQDQEYYKTQNAHADTHARAKGTGKPAPGRTVFIPPTQEEVSDYCRERGNSVDPVAFWNFYAAKGWMIGRNKMRDWRRAVVTWERSGRSGGTSPPGAPPAPPNMGRAAAVLRQNVSEAGRLKDFYAARRAQTESQTIENQKLLEEN